MRHVQLGQKADNDSLLAGVNLGCTVELLFQVIFVLH
jgi:hypothetical protein